ncbi:type IV secretion system protein, partial [Rhizobium ruizarguesonis]
ELSRAQNQNAGQMSLGQQIYAAATKRIDGIDQLRQPISGAADAKDIADLQARLQAETAFLQTEALAPILCLALFVDLNLSLLDHLQGLHAQHVGLQ